MKRSLPPLLGLVCAVLLGSCVHDPYDPYYSSYGYDSAHYHGHHSHYNSYYRSYSEPLHRHSLSLIHI